MNNDYLLDFKNLSDELMLIINLIKNENNNNNNKYDISSERLKKIKWDHFIELCMHHRIYPNLSSVIFANPTIFPNKVRRIIENNYKSNTLLMLRYCAEMRDISKLFISNNLKVLFLKGPFLAKDLYGDISYRTSSDIDILVDIKNLQEAKELLISNGYLQTENFPTILNDWKWRHHHINFQHEEKKIKIEVHWRLNPGPAKEPDFLHLWSSKRKSEVLDYPIYCLGREHLFMFLLSHGARHGWSRLRWLLDIEKIMKQNIDWENLLRLLKEYQYLHLLGKVLILLNQTLNTPIPDKCKFLLTRDSFELSKKTLFYFENIVNLHSPPLSEEVNKYHSSYLFSIKTLKHKIYFLISCLFPYPKDKELIVLPSRLDLLYIPLRPVTWVIRKRRKIV
ncbi:nucleotidyltransferase family protein [Metabacillus indicus]|uniref:Renal dipeptidase n=1 Tax=Metabacillus indicus TaxID=246786 RepID=A0A084H4G1_METID|nr:nucleotidyltransferase family protein [Metabacillus indicus]KEZ50317.1 hypothetical protein AZ46_0206415 [Metabacillus indicus LMG 22858]KEZ54473.1 hypothetical protein GS18_0206090 [Metabacillus indicus]